MVLTGCASIGLAPAKTLSARLSYAYGSITAVRVSSTNALEAQEITSEEATYILTVSDRSRQLLDAAGLALQGGDVKTAEGRLALAVTVLDELNRYLAKKVKP